MKLILLGALVALICYVVLPDSGVEAAQGGSTTVAPTPTPIPGKNKTCNRFGFWKKEKKSKGRNAGHGLDLELRSVNVNLNTLSPPIYGSGEGTDALNQTAQSAKDLSPKPKGSKGAKAKGSISKSKGSIKNIPNV